MSYRFLASSGAFVFAGLAALSFTSASASANVREHVLYAFSNAVGDGTHPSGGLIADGAGTLYGTTVNGGLGFGTVFALQPTGKGYKERILYRFHGGTDGELPAASLYIDATGALFGTTLAGGGACNTAYCGTAFKLTPGGGAYRETIVHRFGASGDGVTPQSGLVADRLGRLYGTTSAGGGSNWGTIYRLTPAGTQYREDVLYSFTGGGDGGFPLGAPTLDASGSLYGTAAVGGIANCGFGNGCGTVFQLAPSGGAYKETNLYTFGTVANDGNQPYAGLLRDAAGSFYGTTLYGGSCHAESFRGCGVAFKLTKHGSTYTETIIHRFTGGDDGKFPEAGLIADAAGDLFGSTISGDGGAAGCYVRKNCGTLFEMSPSGSGYSEHPIFSFRTPLQGTSLQGQIIRDASGALYGTTYAGGPKSEGIVYKVTP